jgi:hypothetical protein
MEEKHFKKPLRKGLQILNNPKRNGRFKFIVDRAALPIDPSLLWLKPLGSTTISMELIYTCGNKYN